MRYPIAWQQIEGSERIHASIYSLILRSGPIISSEIAQVRSLKLPAIFEFH